MKGAGCNAEGRKEDFGGGKENTGCLTGGGVNTAHAL